MIRAAAVALCCLAGAVTAEELIFSDAATQSCLNAATDYQGKKDCIGVSAAQCMEANPVGGTTYGMSGCLGYELTFWDNLLNANYKLAMTRAKGTDAEMAELGSSAAPLAPALRAVQRAWIPYRDATCDYERAQWGGGTGGGPATLWCLMGQTGGQALYLADSWIGE